MSLASSQPLDLLPLDKLSTLGPVTYSLVGWNQVVDKVSGWPSQQGLCGVDALSDPGSYWTYFLPQLCAVRSMVSIQSAGRWELTGLLLLISYRQGTVMLWNATKFNCWLSLIVPIFWVLHSYIGICCSLLPLWPFFPTPQDLFIQVLTFLQTC